MISRDTAMYRSFLICDNPKGVVECRTIRKYRTRSHKMKDKTKFQKTTQNLGTTWRNKRYKVEKNVSKGCNGNNLIGPSSLQLSQVSQGEQSLNDVVHSWSRNLKCGEKKSEDIAKCILKGASDLPDSLITLRRLQRDAPRMQASPFGEQSNPKVFQGPHTSAAGSTSNCKEELNKLIKESLVRQKMFPKMATEGLCSASETFSMSTEGPSVSVKSSKMERGSSLVVKLMGLEEASSRSFPSVKEKQLDGENFLNQIPVCDIDMSKVREIDSIAEKVYPEQKVLKKTLDNMHFKGNLKNSFVKEPKLHVHHFNDTNSKKFDDLPHIALIKPQSTLHQESVKSMPVPPKEFSITKLKAEIASSKTIKHRKGSSSTNMEKGVSKWLNKEGPKFLKGMKLDSKGSNSSDKVKLYCRNDHTSQVNETIDERWKVQNISRKLPEKDISKSPVVTSPQYQRQTTFTKLRKLKGLSRIDKNEISFPKLTGRKNQMKNQGHVAEPEPAKQTVRIATTLEEELLMVCEADVYTDKIGKKCKQRKSSLGDDIIMVFKSGHENYSTTANANKEVTQLKHFLLNNPSFIGHADKLFNLEVDCPNMPQKDETNHSTSNMKPYLDCAYELSERKSLQESQVARSFLLACGGNSRLQISLGRLVEEICNGIDNLKFYRQSSEEKVFEENNVFAMMEKDMKCNGEMNGTWEKGWRLGFSADEAELVVNKIENMLVSALIEEIITNV